MQSAPKDKTRAKKREWRTFKVTQHKVGDEEKKKIRGSFRAALRDPCSGLREGARNHLSAGSIEEGWGGGSVCSYHEGSGRGGRATQKEKERGKKRRG